ncbi:MAG: response regulator, partial [Bacteroidales bacterium]|nr:response regulator [Bacteroidales bacterium]
IGLSLSLELARLMHGDISVNSRHESGSVFTVIVPLGKDHLSENEYVEIKNRTEGKIAVGISMDSHEGDASSEREEKDGEKGKPLILIVDDNRDMRGQLAENLEEIYNVRLAIDGISGLKKALDLIPDLIVTDLMMPNMGGMELCRLVKENELTCHVPVIMLTAKDTPEDRVTGLETGADDYIAKPFKMKELKARIANLINQRRQLRERFSREILLQPSEVTVTSADEKFLNKAIALIEERMKDEKFSLDEFHREMNLSRSTMFRKLSALTGQSPTEFIRTIRLKRAAELLRQNFGNVSEVSLEVGIYNISWFNRSFRKMYGVSPGEYAKKNSHGKNP